MQHHPATVRVKVSVMCETDANETTLQLSSVFVCKGALLDFEIRVDR